MPIDIRNCAFRFQCDKIWEELKPTKKDGVKYCNNCRRQVHLCETSDEVMHAIKRDWCIAIEVKVRSKQGMGAQMLMGEPMCPDE
jgi:hypothetical protein